MERVQQPCDNYSLEMLPGLIVIRFFAFFRFVQIVVSKSHDLSVIEITNAISTVRECVWIDDEN